MPVNPEPIRRPTVIKLIWLEISTRVGLSFLVASAVFCLSFWSMARRELSYTPRQWFASILEYYSQAALFMQPYVEGFLHWISWDINLSGLWLDLAVLGVFVTSTDALLFAKTGRGEVYATLYYVCCFTIILCCSILIDSVMSIISLSVWKELLLFAMWVAAISLCEVVDCVLTVSFPKVRAEWAEYRGLSPSEPFKMLWRAVRQTVRDLFVVPVVLITPLILLAYRSDPFSEGVLGMVVYLVYLVFYWPISDCLHYRSTQRSHSLAEFLQDSYNWRLGVALLLAGVAVATVGIISASPNSM